MATLESLQQKIAKLQAQAETVMRKQSTAVIAQIHGLMKKHGLTLDDLRSGAGTSKAATKTAGKSPSGKSASVARYRDPKTGAEWTGHGRAPAWIAKAKNRDRFLIDSRSTPMNVASKKSAKPGNYVRGPQPAKYRDPQSGLTWSGRGMAPSWLAGAKDRSKFLIDKSVNADAKATKKAAAKTVTRKTPATKRAAKTAN